MTPDYHTRQHYESPLEKSEPAFRTWTWRFILAIGLLVWVSALAFWAGVMQ